MPLTPGSNVSDTIRELHTGDTFKRTAAKFGVGDARRQAIAIAISNSKKGRAAGGMVQGYDLGGGVIPQMGIMPPQPPGMMPAGMAPNQFNTGLNAPMGVSPGSPMPMAAPNGMPPSTAMPPPAPPPVPTGMSQPPSPMGTTPNNPMARPLMARGGALHRTSGGFNMAKGPNLNPSWEQKQEAHGMMHVGPVMSAVPGRTDRHSMMVPSSSYVVPADIVSGRGQGNTLAGMNFFQKAFHMGPYGSSGGMSIKHGSGAPRPPRVAGMKFAAGGDSGDSKIGTPVPVIVAGGEIIIPPENLIKGLHGLLGYRPKDMKHAHRLMDAWMINERKNLRKTLARLPGPAKD